MPRRRRVYRPPTEAAEGAETIYLPIVPVNNIRAYCLHFPASGTDAAQIGTAHPSKLGHMKAVIKNIWRDFFGRCYRLSQTGDDVNLRVGQVCKALQQRFRRGAEKRRGHLILLELVAVIGRQNDNLHLGKFLKDAVMADLQEFGKS